MRFLKRPLTAALLLAAGITSLHAQNGSNFLTQLGPNNAGTEFFFSCPANWDLPGSTAYYIRLYVTAPTATEVKVWAGNTLKRVFVTTPYEIHTVDFTPGEAQPVVRRDEPLVPNDTRYVNKAIRIASDEPVIAYVMNRTSYTSDGMLLLPTSALGREYIVGSYGAVIGTTQELPSQVVITAPYDGTAVTITQPMRSPNHDAGETYTVSLNRGDVYSVMSVGYGGDMSGTVIKADKPVAVTAGQECTYIPNLLEFCCCDHIVEFMLPEQSWGKIYHAVPFSTRLKGDFYRIFAKEKNTKVYINGSEYAQLDGPGGTAGEGWLEYRHGSKSAVEITANKPITVFQYNPSQAYDGVASDPFYVGLTPMEQHATEMIFSTPDQDFPSNYLSIVTDSANFYDIEISPTGVDNWVKISTLSGASSLQSFPTKYKGKKYVGASLEITGGAYKLRGPEPFTGYSYGFSPYDSYGYPVAAFTNDLTSQDITPPTISMSEESNGSLFGAISAMAKGADGVSRLPLSSIRLVKEESTNFRLEMPGFQQALSTSVSYKLVPIDPKKPASATIHAVDMAGNRHSITGSYEPSSAPADIRINGAAIAVGRTLVGATGSGRTTVRNTGKDAAVVTDIRLADGARGFTLLGPAAPFTLDGAGGAGSSLDISVDFKPAGTGVFSDTVLLSNGGVELFRLVVSGIAEQADINIGGEGITFSDAKIEATVAGATTVTNSGKDPVVISGIRLADGARGFRLAGPGVPFTLGGLDGGGNSMEITVEFTPNTQGTHRDTVLLSNDAGVLFRVPLVGITENDQVGAVGTVIAGVLKGVAMAPNPARGSTASLGFTMERKGVVSVALVDGAGKEIRTLADGLTLERGDQSLKLDLDGIPSGNYFVRIAAAGRTIITSLVVAR